MGSSQRGSNAVSQARALTELLQRSGEIGSLIQTYPWSTTPLGPLEGWPQGLQTALGICLTARLPMLIGWGADLRLFCNQACWSLLNLDESSVHALGQPLRESGLDCWAMLASLLQAEIVQERVGSEGEAIPHLWLTQDEGCDRCFSASCSPILDASGEVGGVLAILIEAPPSTIEAHPLPGEFSLQPAELVSSNRDAGATEQGQGAPESDSQKKSGEATLRETEERLRQARDSAHLFAWHVEQERKRVQRELATERGRFETVLQQLPVGVLIADAASGKLVLANEQVQLILGHTFPLASPSESSPPRINFTGRHPDGRPYQEAEWPLARSLRQGEVIVREEIQIERHDQSRITIEVNAAPIRDEQGEIVAAVAIFQDITERKRVESALKRQKEELRLITDAVPALIAYVDKERRYRFVNQAFTTWFGSPPDTAQGERVEDYVGPQAYENMRSNIAAALAGETVSAELWIPPCEEGRGRYVRRQYIPARRSNGEIRGFYSLVNDITDLKLAQEALLRSEKRYRSLVSILTSVVWTVDPEGQFIAPQPAWEAYTGQPWSEHRGWGWLAAVHPEDREALMLNWTTARDQQQWYVGEGRIWHAPSQTYRFFEARAVPLLNEDGSVQEWVGTITDVHDRKQVEYALRRSEAAARSRAEELETLMEAVPAAIWIAHDPRCHEISLNQTAYEWMQAVPGLPIRATSVQGRYTLNPPEQGSLQGSASEVANSHEWPIQTTCRTHEDQAGELEIRLTDNSLAYLYGKTVLLRDEQGQARGAIGAYVDITERKTAEKALQKRNQTLSLLSDVASHLLLTEQPKAFIDDLFEQLAGHLGLEMYFNYLYSPAQQQLYLHAHRGIPQAVADNLYWLRLGQTVSGTVALTQERLVVEDTQRSNNPNTAQIRALGVSAYACYPLLSRGQFIGTLSFGTRTRTHFADDELALMQTVCDQVAAALERSQLLSVLQQRAEELAQANHIKDEFLAVLSHELRSPLNPILGWASLLRRKLTDPAQIKAVETIERNVKLQVQLIDDLLDISRILRGKLNLTLEAVSLEETVNAAIETVHLAADAKSIPIERDFEPGLSSVVGDAGRLQQVVWNLLSNAIKFTPPGGRVSIRLRQLDQVDPALKLPHTASVAPHRAYVQIIVTDTGKGISPSFLPHVFESFRQEDGSTTRQFGGLGLGLAIVRYILEMHGGTIQADSLGEGQGATFTATLPIFDQCIPSHAPQPQLPTRSTQDQPLRNLYLLIVEDDPDSRAFLTLLLEQAGAEVCAIASASEALVTCAQNPPDLLISDIGMPGMDGYQLMQQLRQHPPNRGGRVPAIALTAYASETDARRALEAGFHQHLPKPINPEILINAILDLIQQTRLSRRRQRAR
ncbi:MAG TPA: PAS domain-containing protein [Trichocoleus sp.]